MPLMGIGLADGSLLKGADTIDEAVGQFFDNPDKYSHIAAVNHKQTKMTVSASRHRPHTNAVIEAGNVRARDEVRFTLTPVS
jgi:hypothetical protein